MRLLLVTLEGVSRMAFLFSVFALAGLVTGYDTLAEIARPSLRERFWFWGVMAVVSTFAYLWSADKVKP